MRIHRNASIYAAVVWTGTGGKYLLGNKFKWERKSAIIGNSLDDNMNSES